VRADPRGPRVQLRNRESALHRCTLSENHEGMLSVRKKRILNEAAGIRTFLLQFGRPFQRAKGFCTRTVLKYDLGALLNGGRGQIPKPFVRRNYLCDRA
jgi:hypothetical protein